MKMYAGMAVNELWGETNDNILAPIFELIIMTAGKQYVAGDDPKSIDVVEKVETTRFFVSQFHIDEMIRVLTGYRGIMAESKERMEANILVWAADIIDKPPPAADTRPVPEGTEA